MRLYIIVELENSIFKNVTNFSKKMLTKKLKIFSLKSKQKKLFIFIPFYDTLIYVLDIYFSNSLDTKKILILILLDINKYFILISIYHQKIEFKILTKVDIF